MTSLLEHIPLIDRPVWKPWHSMASRRMIPHELKLCWVFITLMLSILVSLRYNPALHGGRQESQDTVCRVRLEPPAIEKVGNQPNQSINTSYKYQYKQTKQ